MLKVQWLRFLIAKEIRCKDRLEDQQKTSVKTILLVIRSCRGGEIKSNKEASGWVAVLLIRIAMGCSTPRTHGSAPNVSPQRQQIETAS